VPSWPSSADVRDPWTPPGHRAPASPLFRDRQKNSRLKTPKPQLEPQPRPTQTNLNPNDVSMMTAR